MAAGDNFGANRGVEVWMQSAGIILLRLRHFETAPGHTATVVKRIQFPWGQILLVTILFLPGRQMKQEAPNQASEATSEPAPGEDSSSPQR